MVTRDTDWRQGDLVDSGTVAMLPTLAGAIISGESRVVVITHDCDLPNSDEHFVEVVVARVVDALDPQFSGAKHPRCLQLVYECAEKEEGKLVLELRHADRRVIPKEEFERHANKDRDASLAPGAKRTLKQWLAARYGRPAFPNAFETRLRKRASAKRTVEHEIGKILEPDAKYLVGLFFDLDEQRWVEAAPREPYALSISVVYDAVNGGTDARQSAEQVATKLRELFVRVYGKPQDATEIALDGCEAIADSAITLADLRRVDQWRLEYVSLRDSGHGDCVQVGELPA